MEKEFCTDTDRLIGLIRKGNQQGLSDLFDLYYERLYIFAEKFIYDPDKAHDIVQELFVSIWENRDKLEITTSLSHYLFVSIRNRCLNYLQALRIEDRHNQKYLQAHIDSYTLDVLEDEDMLEKIRKMLESLSPQCQKIVELRILKGYKYKEIASEMGISESVVKVQIHRAYQKLKTAFPVLKDTLSCVLFYIFCRF